MTCAVTIITIWGSFQQGGMIEYQNSNNLVDLLDMCSNSWKNFVGFEMSPRNSDAGCNERLEMVLGPSKVPTNHLRTGKATTQPHASFWIPVWKVTYRVHQKLVTWLRIYGQERLHGTSNKIRCWIHPILEHSRRMTGEIRNRLGRPRSLAEGRRVLGGFGPWTRTRAYQRDQTLCPLNCRQNGNVLVHWEWCLDQSCVEDVGTWAYL